MSNVEFDFVVVGAGIVGSWTAKELTKYGKVLLLEQFREPHTRGSSHGQSRLIRSGYKEPFFAEIMPHAFRMWRQAETETKETLLKTTGALCVFDSRDKVGVLEVVNNMKRLCPENLVEFKESDIKLKYPETLNYDDCYKFVFDKSGGVLFAHKAVRTIQQWYQNSGGMFWDSCKVTEIVPLENKILVKTCKSDVIAKSLVLTSGAWTKKLLSNLVPSVPLQAEAVRVYYWKEKKKGIYNAEFGFPAVLSMAEPSVYSLPSLEYPGYMKVCLHGGVPCDPEERDKAVVDKDQVNFLKDYVKKHFPLLESEPAIIETCMYTSTPDEIFLIDTVPGHKNIVIGTGFSDVRGGQWITCRCCKSSAQICTIWGKLGTGFKTSPAVGRLLSELARGVDPFLDISAFRLSRFLDAKKH